MSRSTKQKLCSIHPETRCDTSHLLGFMQGEFTVADDFDQMGMDEVARLFQAAAITTCGFRFNRDEANKR